MSSPEITSRLAKIAAMWRDAPRPLDIVQPGPGQESVWDFPRPPALEPVVRPVRIEHAGRVIADTRRALRVAETASPPCYYIVPEDVASPCLRPGQGTSFCEWKGQAVYWDVVVDERVVRDAGWSYPEPYEEYAALAGYLGFYAQKLDRCTVGGVVVQPQPGGFYGGWITPELVGPFKGSPGSRGW